MSSNVKKRCLRKHSIKTENCVSKQKDHFNIYSSAFVVILLISHKRRELYFNTIKDAFFAAQSIYIERAIWMLKKEKPVKPLLNYSAITIHNRNHKRISAIWKYSFQTSRIFVLVVRALKLMPVIECNYCSARKSEKSTKFSPLENVYDFQRSILKLFLNIQLAC